MTRPVVPGEPILPHMTARWFNNTLKTPQVPPPPREKDLRHHNEDSATFVPSLVCTKAERFTAVAPLGRLDEYGNYVARAQFVDKEGLSKSNWIITQAEMAEGYRTQKCVYAGVTYAKVNILDANHKFVDLNLETLELESSTSGKGLLLQAGGLYSFISIETYQDNSNTTTSTSTTTTSIGDCPGTCKFEEVDGGWVEVENNCNPTTSTTTTTTTSTSTSDSTTTYHNQDCKTSTSTSTTTTPLPGTECRCVPPSFCPDVPDACVNIACSKAEGPPPCDPTSTTTTTTTTTSTSTTPCDCDTTTTGGENPPGCDPGGGPPCTNNCTFVSNIFGQWVRTGFGCCSGCYCVAPDTPPAECGTEVIGTCICPPVVPPEPCGPATCDGGGLYYCVPSFNAEGGTWMRSTFLPCEGNCLEPGCSCVETNIPTGDCTPCTTAYSSCGIRCVDLPTTTTCSDTPPFIPDNSPCAHCYGGSSTTTSTTSTTTTDPCSRNCRIQWNGSAYINVSSNCPPPCICLTNYGPPPPGEECNIYTTPCVQAPPTTTSTTTSTTSTSTTTTELLYLCCWNTTQCDTGGSGFCMAATRGADEVLSQTCEDYGLYTCGEYPGPTNAACETGCVGSTTTSTSTTTTGCPNCGPPQVGGANTAIYQCGDGAGFPPTAIACENCDPGYEPASIANWLLDGRAPCSSSECTSVLCQSTTSTTTSTSTSSTTSSTTTSSMGP